MQGSDGGSVVFASTPAQVATTAPSPTVPRKTDFPQTGLPLSNGPLGMGGSASPISITTSQGTTTTPVPSPATAALPPPSLPPPYSTPMQVCSNVSNLIIFNIIVLTMYLYIQITLFCCSLEFQLKPLIAMR